MSVEIRMPQLTQTMSEAKIVRWLKKEGEEVEKGQPLLEVETDKAVVEIEAPASGFLLQVLVKEGDIAQTDTLLAIVGKLGEKEEVITQVGSAETSRKPISPAARRKAKEHNIDTNKVVGTGPDGLITERDVIEFSGRETSGAGARQSEWGEEEIVSLTGIRKAMSERLSLSHQMVAGATTFAEVDMTRTLELHQNMQIPITPFVVKAVAVAIPGFPTVNSSLADGKVVIKKYISIGVAVSTEQGLVVPVIHNTEMKTLEDIAERLKQLAEKARDEQLSLDDISGGTFTVTNSGIFGSLFFAPIVNYPETAIIGMGKVMKAPVVRDEQIVIRSMMHLSLSYDHRVIDGATAVRFLQKVKEGLEIPENLVSQKRA